MLIAGVPPAATTSPAAANGVTARSAATLKPVLDVIPDRCYERSTAKGLAYVGRAVVIYAAAIAGLVLTDRWWLVLPLWLVAGLSIAGLFVLGHDAAHGALFDGKRLNRTVGRWCMVPSLHVHEAWTLGHNRIHHGHTLRQDMDFVWHPLTVAQYRALSRRGRLAHRFEWSAFGAGAYYLRHVWWNKMIRFTPPERYRAGIARDKRFLGGVLVVAVGLAGAAGLVVGGGVLGALWMVVKTIVVPFLVFTWLIGFTVYVHHIAPDIRWWPRRSWTSFAGQVEGTTVLRVPRVLNLFFHNIFVHVPHHVDVRIPFYALPEAADAIGEAFPDAVHFSRFRWRDYVASTRACKLYDFGAQEWLRYDDAAAATS